MTPIVRILFGSHLYGTNTPQSDFDYKSVHIPSKRDILLQRVTGSVCNKREKAGDGIKNEAGDVDEESYSLQRYLGLLVQGQTVAIDMLFAPSPLMATPLWQHIRANRRRLLTKKSAAFVGYCRTQANKYGIKGSRVAAAKEAMEGFNNAMLAYGATSKVGEFMDATPRTLGEHTRIVEKETTAGRFETYFECCNRMVGFKNTVKEAVHIFARIYEEYGKRARLAQDNEGIDWKALSHAVRVGEEALELLNTGEITFPLKNAAHIMEIKMGRITYDVVSGEIEALLGAVEEAAEKSPLREEADTDWIDNFVMHKYESEVFHG